MTHTFRTVAMGAAVALLAASGLRAAEANTGVLSFGSLKPPAVESARAEAESWLNSVGKMDADAFAKIWEAEDAPILDRIAATFELGSAEAAALLKVARESDVTPPTDMPEILTDDEQPAFFRANLALAFARALTDHRVYEQSLEALRTVAPEQVVDPAAYFFHKAVAEHATLQKHAALRSIDRLLDDVTGTPERYRMVAALMAFDMQRWPQEEKHLENISRLMDNSERRLGLGRGGKETQEIQKKIVFRLDELIKEKENQAGGGQCAGGACPKGGVPGSGGAQGPTPMADSNIATNSGPGNVTEKKLQNLAEVWGKLPEAERAKAMMEITRDLPPRYREVIENYLKSLSRTQR